MNEHNFNQTGGYPLETDTLSEIQNAYSIFNALGEMSGDKTIVRGCTINGSTVSDGFVYIAGQFFEFKGGLQQSKVIIRQEPVSKPFQNGDVNEVLYKRYVTFGTGADAMNWSDFTRINPIKELQKALVPVGTVIMWSGSIANIPEGWVLCNGSNGTPPLSGKFVVGYDSSDPSYNAIGKTGGEKQTTLNIDQIPAHNHSGTTNNSGSHGHTGRTAPAGNHRHYTNVRLYNESGPPLATGSGDIASGNKRGYEASSTWYSAYSGNHYHGVTIDNAGDHRHSFTTNSIGGSKPHENRPPYYTMAYIMYKG